MTTWRLPILLIASLLLTGGPAVLHAKPNPPATRPAATEKSLMQWVAGLDDRSPDVRDESAARLMQLSRRDLPALKRVVERSQPLSAGQKMALHDVVVHVWLTDEPYEKQDVGFLGLSLQPNNLWDEDDAREGVLVVSRMPGFAAYGVLADGDVIIEIREAPNVRFSTVSAFADRISRFKPGDELNLVVQRGGRQVTAKLRLSARPDAAGDLRLTNSDMETLLGERILAAEKYYEETFARLVGEEYSRAD